MTETQAYQLNQSLEKFGLCQPIVINLDNTIIGGHQRYELLKENESVPVFVPDRLLNEKEAQELALRLNHNGGSWDWDILANDFDLGDLLTVGFDPLELGLEEKPQKKPKPKITITFDSTETLHSVYDQIASICDIDGVSVKVKA